MALAAGLGTSQAQSTFTSEDVSFESAALRDGGVTVRGTLRLPEGASGRLPVVLVLHSSSGAKHDRHSEAFIAVLNRAGIATLWIEMFIDGGARPRSSREVMPHVVGSLLWLAAHPRIDPQRIGVMGFSYGGVMSLLTASQEVIEVYAGGKARFAAHLPFYPVCWAHLRIVEGSNRVYDASTYQRLTGAPVHILTGDRDDYDAPDSCPKFAAALPEAERKHVAVTVYPNARHSFDVVLPTRESYDPYAYEGRGGTVTLEHDPDATAKALAFTVAFFSRHLQAKP